MPVEPDGSGGPGDPGDDVPLAVLQNFEIDPGADFPERVRRGIERRFLGRDVLGFCWTAIGQALMDWLALSFTGFNRRPPEKGSR